MYINVQASSVSLPSGPASIKPSNKCQMNPGLGKLSELNSLNSSCSAHFSAGQGGQVAMKNMES